MKRFSAVVEVALVGLVLATALAACSPENACGLGSSGASGTAYHSSGAACAKGENCPASSNGCSGMRRGSGPACPSGMTCPHGASCGTSAAGQACGAAGTCASANACCGREGCACPRSSASTAPAATSAAATVSGPAVVGSFAPAFSLNDVAGRRVSLADFRGKVTVLEWTNPSCPFVKRHYEGGGLPALVREATGQGVAWLTIQSSRPDHAQYAEPGALEAKIRGWRSTPTAILMDPQGTVGKLYGAKTTPHLFVIDASGKLVYAGAIDSDPSGSEAAPVNYVRRALSDLAAGRAVATAQTQSYGCGVKY